MKSSRFDESQLSFLTGGTKYLYTYMYVHAFTSLAAPVKKLRFLYEIGLKTKLSLLVSWHHCH